MPRLILFALLLIASATRVCADQASVAVASNFAGPMQALITTFEKQTPHSIKLITGSSGKIYAQIQHGAPFDLFFSADSEKPVALIENGAAVSGSLFTYAIGRLALWSRNAQTIQTKSTGAASAIIASNNYRKLALANPKLAPYGQAAVQVLDYLQLAEKTQTRWVQGENIAQTYQFVMTGNAEIGFVALSQVLDNGLLKAGSVWVVPTFMHEPIKQQAVILKRASNNPAASAFSQFVRSDNAKAIISRYGYDQDS